MASAAELCAIQVQEKSGIFKKNSIIPKKNNSLLPIKKACKLRRIYAMTLGFNLFNIKSRCQELNWIVVGAGMRGR
jgi:hypothetical protein